MYFSLLSFIWKNLRCFVISTRKGFTKFRLSGLVVRSVIVYAWVEIVKGMQAVCKDNRLRTLSGVALLIVVGSWAIVSHQYLVFLIHLFRCWRVNTVAGVWLSTVATLICRFCSLFWLLLLRLVVRSLTPAVELNHIDYNVCIYSFSRRDECMCVSVYTRNRYHITIKHVRVSLYYGADCVSVCGLCTVFLTTQTARRMHSDCDSHTHTLTLSTCVIKIAYKRSRRRRYRHRQRRRRSLLFSNISSQFFFSFFISFCFCVSSSATRTLSRTYTWFTDSVRLPRSIVRIFTGTKRQPMNETNKRKVEKQHEICDWRTARRLDYDLAGERREKMNTHTHTYKKNDFRSEPKTTKRLFEWVEHACNSLRCCCVFGFARIRILKNACEYGNSLQCCARIECAYTYLSIHNETAMWRTAVPWCVRVCVFSVWELCVHSVRLPPNGML